jgi:hypothetical protein
MMMEHSKPSASAWATRVPGLGVFYLLVLCSLLMVHSAFADAPTQPPRVQITAFDPASGGALASGDALYLQIQYQSETPLRFQVEGYRNGAKSDGALSNTVPVYPAGEGVALAWLAFRQSHDLDEVRVKVMTPQWQEIDRVRMPLAIAWVKPDVIAPRVRADWVERLSAEHQALSQRGLEQAIDDGGGGFDWLIMFMGWSIPGYIVLQAYLLRRCRGGWRTAAWLPLFVTVPALVHALIALAMGSNLWPLILLFVTPLTFLYLVGVMLLSRLIAPQRA